MRLGFDNQRYLELQSARIKERIQQFGGKLYLEFGGKLFDDYHASRVLPGFEPDSKMRMLQTIKEDVEIVLVINSEDIERSKLRGDLGIPYDQDVLRLIDVFHGLDLFVGSVVITMYNDQPATVAFFKKLTQLGIKVYRHYAIDDYPTNISHVVSPDGLGRNDYIKTSRSLVVVTAPGPGSGKMATCLSQLYQEHLRGVKAGYAKFETFPVWNLPLKHPLNLAYEAATADLSDVNMIDPFHLEAYGEKTVNYNRDVETFPVLNAMFDMIMGESPYKSPTDMGVNMLGYCITDDDACCQAAQREILRRYYIARVDLLKGKGDENTVRKIELLMRQAGVSMEIAPYISAALQKASLTNAPAAAMELPDGRVISGKTTNLLGAVSATLLNALKNLAGIEDGVDLISPESVAPIQRLKTVHFHSKNPRLHTDEVLIALSVSAVSDKNAERAMQQLGKLRGCDMHSSVILSSVDSDIIRKLGINLTTEPVYEKHQLYHK